MSDNHNDHGAVQLERREGKGARDRRDGKATKDRRKVNVPVAVERRAGDRRKTARRRQIDPTTCERDYTTDEIEFMQAMDAYKRSSGRMFPTCSEVLEVIRSLGYVRVQTGVPALTMASAETQQPVPA